MRAASKLAREQHSHGHALHCDWLSPHGFLHALGLGATLADGGQSTHAPVCSSWTWINRGTPGHGPEFESVIKSKAGWEGAWVQAVARDFVDDLPAPARSVLQDPRWLGGPLATLINPACVDRQDIDRHAYLISKILQASPSKAPQVS